MVKAEMKILWENIYKINFFIFGVNELGEVAQPSDTDLATQ